MLPKLEQMDEQQLDNRLSQFYIEARSKRGEEHSNSSLISFRNAIGRHLQPKSEVEFDFLHQFQWHVKCQNQEPEEARQRKRAAQRRHSC